MNRTREQVEGAARRLHDSQQKAGNSQVTYEQCRERVAQAVTRSDRKRSDNPEK